MKKTFALAVLAAGTLFAVPSFAQTVGSCPSAGAAASEQPEWVLFDLGSDRSEIATLHVTRNVQTPRCGLAFDLVLHRYDDDIGDIA